MGCRRSSPDPGLGPSVELRGGDAPGQIDFTRVGKALAGEGIAAKEPPPPLLQVEPARSFRNEHVMQTRVVCHPGARLQAAVTTQVIRDDEEVAGGIVGFNQLQEFDIIRRVARRGTSGQFFAIEYP